MQLPIARLETNLTYEGIAALPPETIDELSLSPQDAVSVRGTDGAGRLLRVGRASETDTAAVGLDRPTRGIVGDPGEEVTVTRMETTSADSVTVEVPQELSGPESYAALRNALETRPLCRSYVPLIPPRLVPGDGEPVVVVETEPAHIVTVTAETHVKFVVHRDGPTATGTDSLDATDFETVHVSAGSRRRTSGRGSRSTGGRRRQRSNAGDDLGNDPNEFRVPTSELGDVTYDDLGGVDDAVRKLRTAIELPFNAPEVARSLGEERSTGILLSGPPGTGKTMLAKALANETDAAFYRVRGPEVMSKLYGEAEERVRDLFAAAREQAPSVIFFDEFDSLGQSRGGSNDSTQRRVVGQLLSEMDGLEENEDVVVVASTNDPESIDPALRRPGRLGTHVEVGIPDEEGRRDILDVHAADVPLSPSVDLADVAARTHGYTGADLEELVDTACEAAFERHLSNAGLTVDDILDDARRGGSVDHLVARLDDVTVSPRDIERALDDVGPSGLVDHQVTVPETSWDDVVGHEHAKAQLKEAAILPLEHGDAFEAMDVTPRAGVLLAGPPGTGKTMLAKAVATEADSNFMHVKGPELLNKWVGESEAGVRDVFETARETGPTVLFFDEIDSIVPERGNTVGDSGVTDRVVTQFLSELDGLADDGDVTVVAATNRPDALDPAVCRDGRLGEPIHVGLPDVDDRRNIFERNTHEKPLGPNADLDALARWTDGLAGSAIAAICDRAATLSIREAVADGRDPDTATVTMRHFEAALQTDGGVTNRDGPASGTSSAD